MKRPKVTIGLPVYNGEKLLPRALDCWLAQDYHDFELIISDNGSTDGTEAICLDYRAGDPRISYHRFAQNMGALRSFTKLIDLAEGEYFVMAFYNDFFAADYLSSCLEVLEDDPSVVLCYAGAHFIDEEGQSIGNITDKFRMDQENVTERYEQILSKLGLCSCFHGVMRTEAIQATIPFHLSAAPDVTFLCELILRGKFIQIDRPLIYRSQPGHQKFTTLIERWKSDNENIYPYMPGREINYLPFMDLIMILVNYISETDFDDQTKERLITSTYEILFSKYGANIVKEMNYLLEFLAAGDVRYLWKDEQRWQKGVDKEYPNLNRAYLMKRLAELDLLINFYPDRADLYLVTGGLLFSLGRVEEAKLRVETGLRIQPGHGWGSRLLNTIQGG